MADKIDIANDNAQRILDAKINEAKQAGPMHIGRCLFCGQKSDARWCNAEHRDEWQYLQNLRGGRYANNA